MQSGVKAGGKKSIGGDDECENNVRIKAEENQGSIAVLCIWYKIFLSLYGDVDYYRQAVGYYWE